MCAQITRAHTINTTLRNTSIPYLCCGEITLTILRSVFTFPPSFWSVLSWLFCCGHWELGADIFLLTSYYGGAMADVFHSIGSLLQSLKSIHYTSRHHTTEVHSISTVNTSPLGTEGHRLNGSSPLTAANMVLTVWCLLRARPLNCTSS